MDLEQINNNKTNKQTNKLKKAYVLTKQPLNQSWSEEPNLL